MGKKQGNLVIFRGKSMIFRDFFVFSVIFLSKKQIFRDFFRQKSGPNYIFRDFILFYSAQKRNIS